MAGIKTILIIDDSPIITSRLRYLLESLSDTGLILHADNYAKALPLLQGYSPDIVLLDIHLPDINGIEALQYIKKEFSPIIVIMMSNQAWPIYRSRCKALGANFFIDKSTEFSLIPQIITSLL
ncbi:MAG TPA: response regulator transcription factor [Puia sp.]|jgi:DNA-binding NarL/FixJ family response regulator|nr:response regulator transcription factor [Puia sp.]